MNKLDALLSESADVAIVEPCLVGVIASDLEEPYLSAFLKIVNTTYPQGGLSDLPASKKLAQAGLRIGASTLNRHRRGLCYCAKG